ncbi:MAG: PilW family protein [Gammaproteobacteria bacterium]
MYRSKFHTQSGLSLIELMIAMVVGLILMAGVLSIFLSSRQSYGINSAVARIQENGRFALNFLRTDARNAGYMGCATSTTTASYLNPVADNLPYNFAQAIYGFHFTGTVPGPTENPAPDTNATDWTPNLDPYLTGKVLPNTDVLVVRFAQRDPIYITTITSPTATSATVNTLLGASDQPALAPGDLFLASNCLSAIVLQATSATSGTTLEYTSGGSAPGNNGEVIPQSFVGAMVVSPTTAVFYIGQGADTSPALFKASTDTTQPGGFSTQEMVSGVENMRVLYGVDLTGSQVPSEYVTADVVDAANEWADVVSVRIGLLVRSNTAAVPLPSMASDFALVDSSVENPVTAPLDTRMRQIFIATVGIRNSLP